MLSFADYQRAYQSQHTTLGCKITHMFGIPMIAVSLPLFLIHWQIATLLFIVGWILQFIGHYAFEHNRPVFLGNPLNPMTYICALLFAGREWLTFFSGKPLVEPIIRTGP